MNSQQETLQAMRHRLETAGIPFESINVFGAARCNVHVVCVGRNTAERWQRLLAQAFKGARVYCGEHEWNAAKNKHYSQYPTKRKGWLIAVAA